MDCLLLSWRILLVDDDASIRQVTRLVLTHFGQLVETATSVSEGLACLELRTFDLVITDYNMPGGNGSELIRTMKARGLSSRSMIITGQDPASLSLTLSIEETPDLIVAKPFKADVLRQAVRSIQQNQGSRLPPVSSVA